MRTRLIAAALILILLVAVVFAPVPGDSIWSRTLHNFAHGPVFGAVAVLLLIVMRVGGSTRHPVAQYAFAFAGAGVLGVATEVLQLTSGRDASWLDLRRDLLGSAAFLLVFAALDRRWSGSALRTGAFTAGAVLLAYLAAPVVHAALEYRGRARMFPVIADFSGGVNSYFIGVRRAMIDLAPLPERLSAGPAEHGARVRLMPAQYAGVHIDEPAPDWRGYETLAIEIANPSARDLDLVVRVHDAHHNNEFTDRYNQRLTAPALERRVFRFSLADVERAPRGRQMDMSRIAGLVVFRAEISEADEMYLTRVWLE